jgi:hypothetical protein
MSGALQAVFQNQRGFGLKIGDAFGGGFYAGQISTAGNGIADYNLVVGPKASADTSLKWKLTNDGSDPTSVIDGPTNSATMNSATYPMAQFCEGLTIGGFSDWYMPAKNELEVCYYNLKPTTGSNSTSHGINDNSVPKRTSNYTTSDPPQTSAADFQSGNSEAYSGTDFYRPSTEKNAVNAWRFYFGSGSQGDIYKTSTLRVRAIRRVAV